MREQLVSALVEATGLEQPVVEKALSKSTQVDHGDFAFPCFLLAKAWKIAPPECAKKLATTVRLPAGISKAEAAGPYLNFFLERGGASKSVLQACLASRFEVAKKSPTGEAIVIEYSGVNIAKPYHVGHLRNIIIGRALDRIHRHLGYQVTSINHLGDWGTQFGFVWAGCELWGRPEEETVDGLVAIYRRATALKEAQANKTVAAEDAALPDINEMARAYFKRLEDGDKDAYAFWKWCLDISLEYFKNLDHRLGVFFDHYMGESFFSDKLDAVEAAIRKSGILQDSRGALGVDLGKQLGFARVFAEDGRSLYITRDLAAADYRDRTFKPTKILYVVDARQTLHFKQIVAIFERMNHPVAKKIVHIPYGHVPGITTRGSGGQDRTSLKALLDEAHERAKEAYRSEVSKKPEGLDEELVGESVGLGAVFFNYLCRSNIKDFHFSWEDALSFQGDTGPYIQYALARLNSIEAKAKEAGITVSNDFDASLLSDDDSYALVSYLSKFEDALKKAATEYEPFHVANYALDLAKMFSGVYRKLRVIGEESKLAEARLALFMAVRNVLHTALSLIGVPPVDRM
ncbi:MAG: arginine--tRNA ligase [Deltaproteobacteria bacterium]|nr:arginine--tRNA ligase [Deltaproteobacteria bacterium]